MDGFLDWVEKSAKMMVQERGIHRLLQMLEVNKDHKEFPTQALHVLSNVSKFAIDEIDHEFMIRVIYGCAMAHEGNVEVLLSAYNTVGSLAFSSRFTDVRSCQ